MTTLWAVSSEILLVLLVSTGVTGSVLAYRLLRAWRGGTAIRVNGGEWNKERELKQFVDGSNELQSLYERLQFSPEVERRAESLMEALKREIHVEIPDYDAFREALAEVRVHVAGNSENGQRKYVTDDDALLTRVLESEDDPDRVLDILNEDPVDSLLPFVEQIPLYRNGAVTWRTPMEVKVLHKRPVDRARFIEILDDLDRLVRSSKLRRRENAKANALEAISRLRRDLGRENAYLPTSIQLIESKLLTWLRDAHHRSARGQRDELDDLLRRLLEVHHRYGWCVSAGAKPDAASANRFRNEIQAHAKSYVETRWMHTPLLTSHLLADLLGSELVAARREKRGPAHVVLRRVWEEVSSGNYDSDETIRRLREVEARGLFVHSLNYALLRLNRLDHPDGGRGARSGPRAT